LKSFPFWWAARRCPKADLPESLQLLSRRQALELSDGRFPRDVADLIEALKSPAGEQIARSRWIKPALAASIVVAAVAAGIWLWPKPPHPAQLAAAPRENTIPAATSDKTATAANITGN
jgi:hypothetical protein